MTRKLSPEERRRQFMEAAIEIFAEKGYDNTSVRDIIDKVGVSKGGFYHHYESKEELMEDIAEAMVEKMAVIIERIAGREDLSALEKLNQVISRVNSFKVEKTSELTGLLFEIYSDEKNIKLESKLFSQAREKAFPYFKAIIDEGIAGGSMKTDYPGEAANFFLNLMMQYQREVAKPFTEAIAERDREKLEEQKKKYRFLQEVLEFVLGLDSGELVLEEVACRTIDGMWERTKK